MSALESAQAFSSVVDGLGGLFGTSSGGSGTTSGTTKESLNISDEAIEKIIQDMLSEAGGLKDIFSEEQASGIFDSSVAAQASGDFAAKVVGEIAKLRAEKVTEIDSTTTQSTEQGGVLDGIGDFFGF